MTDDNRMGPAYRPTSKSPIASQKGLAQLQRERYVDMYGQEPAVRTHGGGVGGSSPQHGRRGIHYSSSAIHDNDDPTVDPYAQAMKRGGSGGGYTSAVAGQFDEYSPLPPHRDGTGVNRSLGDESYEFSDPNMSGVSTGGGGGGGLPNVSAWIPPQPCSRCDDLSKQLDTAMEKVHKMRVNFEMRERKRVMDEISGISTTAKAPCKECEDLRHQVNVLSKKLHTMRTQRRDFVTSQDSYKNLVNLTSQFPMGGGDEDNSNNHAHLMLPHSPRQDVGTMPDLTLDNLADMESEKLLDQL